MNKFQKLFFICLSIFPALILLISMIKYSVNFPFWDEWEIPTLIQQIDKKQLFLKDLFAQHNEHRLFFSRIIILINFYLTKWNILYEIAINFILVLLIFSIFVGSFMREKQNKNNRNFLPYICLISFLVFSVSQFEIFFNGWVFHILLNILAVISGIFVLSSEERSKSRSLFVGIFLGVVATYSFANGLIFWVFGLFILINKWGNERKKYGFIWIIIMSFIFISYFWKFYEPKENSTLLSLNFDFPKFLQHVLIYIGGPLSVGDALRAYIIGVINFFLFIFLFNKNR